MTTVVGELGKVDLVTAIPDGRVCLAMTQVEHWDDSDDQLLTIHSKVNNYLTCILDGQLAEVYPTLDVSRWLIRIDCQTEPSPRVAEFLVAIASAVEGQGGGLEVALLSS